MVENFNFSIENILLILPQITTLYFIMDKETILFTEGFTYKGLKFGWRGRKLFRLPTDLNGRHFTLRKVPQIKITENITGFRISRDKKSMNQVKEMTEEIQVIVKKSICKGC